MALILDTGALYAYLDRDDAAHPTCRDLITNTSEQLVIPAPVLVEVDHLVSTRLHGDIMLRLLRAIVAEVFTIEHLTGEDLIRVHELMARYADSKIGFVDAAVFAIVERWGETKLATLDRRHFSLLRPRHTDVLTLLPE